jgi:2-iminobutanoate/2-iminopropanoate deaminase
MTDTNASPLARLPFSPFRRHGDLIYVSGQASTDNNGAIVSDAFEGEFRRAMENLRAILHSAGTDLGQVIQVHAYVRDPANLPHYNRLYREYFTEPYPARTTLTGCLPETLQFEIDCVAVSPAPDKDSSGSHSGRTA